MIYICSHTAPAYQLEYTHTFINNNDDTNLSNIAYDERYRHLRGIYNIYKNFVLPDTIGIFQYKRYFDINYIPEGYRGVFPNSYNDKSALEIYDEWHIVEDLYALEKVLNDPGFSDYIRTATAEQYYHNMFIMNRQDFCDYCKYLFDSLFEYDKVTRNIQHEGYNSAVCAFLGERLGSYWIYKNIPLEERYTLEVVG